MNRRKFFSLLGLTSIIPFNKLFAKNCQPGQHGPLVLKDDFKVDDIILCQCFTNDDEVMLIKNINIVDGLKSYIFQSLTTGKEIITGYGAYLFGCKVIGSKLPFGGLIYRVKYGDLIKYNIKGQKYD